MTQEWTVGLIVLAAAMYALWYWLPARFRQRLGRVHAALDPAPGCGACNRCGAGACSTVQALPGESQPAHWKQR
jgi:hypothetical protein